jgi:3-methyladenine DNA glycosylase AlkD
MTVQEILQRLESLGTPENIAGMARYGIKTEKAFGVSAPELKKLAKEIGRHHALALALWATKVHEARAVAYLIDNPQQVSPAQMDDWAADFDNWAICDGTCGHLFRRTPFAYEKAFDWAEREEEFVRRAGIVLMASLAVHDKKADDAKIERFLPFLEKHSDDERNFVKKSVNWALRQIGKRSIYLNKKAIATGNRIKAGNTKSARWIASGALRELKSEKIQKRLQEKLLK